MTISPTLSIDVVVSGGPTARQWRRRGWLLRCVSLDVGIAGRACLAAAVHLHRVRTQRITSTQNTNVRCITGCGSREGEGAYLARAERYGLEAPEDESRCVVLTTCTRRANHHQSRQRRDRAATSNQQPARADRSGHEARAWAQARGRARGVRPHVVGGRDELEVEPGVGNAVLLRAPLLRKVRAVMRLHDRAAVAHDGIRSPLRSAAPAQHAHSQAATHTAGERRPPTRSPHPTPARPHRVGQKRHREASYRSRRAATGSAAKVDVR